MSKIRDECERCHKPMEISDCDEMICEDCYNKNNPTLADKRQNEIVSSMPRMEDRKLEDRKLNPSLTISKPQVGEKLIMTTNEIIEKYLDYTITGRITKGKKQWLDAEQVFILLDEIEQEAKQSDDLVSYRGLWYRLKKKLRGLG